MSFPTQNILWFCDSLTLYIHMLVEAKKQARAGKLWGKSRQEQQKQAGRIYADWAAYLHGDATVWALIPKGATLLLEGDEVPDGDDGVLGNVEVEELDAGKGAEGAELSWCAGEVVSHKEPVCKGDPRGSQ